MNKNISIPSHQTVTLDVVEGNLSLGRHATVKGVGNSLVLKVSGAIFCEGNNVFECYVSAKALESDGNVTVHGDLIVEGEVEVEDGWLEVHGNMSAKSIDIDYALRVSGNLITEEVDVGGSIKVEGNAKAKEIEAGGSFESKGETAAEKIDVGGSVSVESKVDIGELEVGGKAKVNGGKIRRVDVGGSFESKDSLEFERIEVGGTVYLSGVSKGREIEVGGSLKVEGDLEFGRIEVGGAVEISGSGKGQEIDVGGKVEVGGSLTLSETLEVGGKVRVEKELSARNVEVGGVLDAHKIKAENNIEVGGSIATKVGAAAHFVEIAKRGTVRGLIKADSVIVGKEASVEDISGKEIYLKSGATAENIYGELIKIDPYCRIHGDLHYTRELKIGENVSLTKVPQKVDNLPF